MLHLDEEIVSCLMIYDSEYADDEGNNLLYMRLQVLENFDNGLDVLWYECTDEGWVCVGGEASVLLEGEWQDSLAVEKPEERTKRVLQ